MEIYQKIIELIKENQPFVLATVIKAKGSTPRSEASKMIILKDGTIIGTIGGGLVEYKVIEEGVALFKERKSKVVNYVLDKFREEGINMICGGEMEVFLEYSGTKDKLVIIGAGHVGKALYSVASRMNFQVVVIDDRQEWANKENFPEANISCKETYIEAIKDVEINEDAFVVIVTKDADESSLQEVISKNCRYIGMIGSKRKVLLVKKNLLEKGVEQAKLDRIYAPIGLDIGGETPEEIAISILGEILAVKYQKEINWRLK